MDITFAVRKRRGTFELSAEGALGGGITGLFGASGSGKTTLLHCLTGFLTPDEGRITVDGEDYFASASGINRPMEQRALGMVFQDGLLFPHLSVRENLFYHVPARRSKKQQQTYTDIIDLLNLYCFLDRRPDSLSGGERQRVALGRVLMHHPRALLLDEPVSSLDAPARHVILEYLRRIQQSRQIPVVYVSHNFSEHVQLCDRMVSLENGRIVFSGEPLAWLERHSAAYVADQDPLENTYVLPLTAMPGDGLAEVNWGGQPLQVACRLSYLRPCLQIGIAASDILVAVTPPQQISARNVIPAVVKHLRGVGDHTVIVEVAVGTQRCLAELTARSVRKLGIRAGQKIFLIIKARSCIVWDQDNKG